MYITTIKNKSEYLVFLLDAMCQRIYCGKIKYNNLLSQKL